MDPLLNSSEVPRRSSAVTNEALLRFHLCIELLRSTGEREFPMQLASTLAWIASHDGCLQEEIVKVLSISPSAVSRNVTWLGQKHRLGRPGLDFVRRTVDGVDPKKNRVFLTPKGKLFAKGIENLMNPINQVEEVEYGPGFMFYCDGRSDPIHGDSDFPEFLRWCVNRI